MRTITLKIDETLLNEALYLTNLATPEELLHLALQTLIQSRRKKSLLDLAEKIQFTDDFDLQTHSES